MNEIQKYVTSVICASVICAVTLNTGVNNGTHGTLIRMLAGLFMVVTVVSPIADLRIEQAFSYIEDLPYSVGLSVAEGKLATDYETSKIIKQQAETYIGSKAAELGVDAQVEVTLTDSMPSIPYEVRISGNVSPYARTQLKRIIENDLGIPEEKQLWN